MRIAVCEDSADDRGIICEYIREYCRKNCYMCEISCFESGEAFLSRFEPGAFDTVFLDIYMTGMTGVETARRIRETDTQCNLIFITVSSDHALDGYSVGAMSYVVKPVRKVNMERALYMCRQDFLRSSRMITVPVNRQITTDIPLAGIRYVEVFGKDCVFHMGAGTIRSRIPLSDIEAKLGGPPFLRCHRCYIVNMNHVEDVREQEFLMNNGDVIPIRKNRRSETKLAIARFITESAF